LQFAQKNKQDFNKNARRANSRMRRDCANHKTNACFSFRC